MNCGQVFSPPHYASGGIEDRSLVPSIQDAQALLYYATSGIEDRDAPVKYALFNTKGKEGKLRDILMTLLILIASITLIFYGQQEVQHPGKWPLLYPGLL